jgi:hypothetical protein
MTNSRRGSWFDERIVRPKQKAWEGWTERPGSSAYEMSLKEFFRICQESAKASSLDVDPLLPLSQSPKADEWKE